MYEGETANLNCTFSYKCNSSCKLEWRVVDRRRNKVFTLDEVLLGRTERNSIIVSLDPRNPYGKSDLQVFRISRADEMDYLCKFGDVSTTFRLRMVTRRVRVTESKGCILLMRFFSTCM